MDYGESENAGNTQVPAIELDEKFIAELETDEITLERGEGMNRETCSFQYVTNALELLNERYDDLKYDPNMDIVKDQYEGGFKLWEGTYDLINLIYNNMQDLNLNGKKVLDLGCGSGLVGIFCLKAYDLQAVTFQDYNLDVLQFSTLANIIKNGLDQQIPKCKFISGDWSLTPEKVANNTNEIVTKLHGEQGEASKFDAIFMSEVLYNSDHYQKLGNIINDLLNPDGVCIISSKLYYFGVNGSVDEFKDFMQANFGHLNIQTLQEISNKKSNKREIFSVRHPPAA